MLTATTGAGGGLLLLSCMPGFLPPAALIPVHGLVQLASNLSRAVFALKKVDWRVLLQYLLGACAGAALGSRFVVIFPVDYLPLLLGTAILLMAWMPDINTRLRFPANFLALGAFQTFVSLFIGSPGPFSLAVLFRTGMTRDQIVATNSSMMTILHIIKVLTFGLLGFVFQPYLILIAGMIVSATLGSYAGTRLRLTISEELFKKILRIILTLLALRMFYRTLMR